LLLFCSSFLSPATVGGFGALPLSNSIIVLRGILLLPIIRTPLM